MLVNADLSLRAIVRPDQHQWVASPQAGVERMMLDRKGGERARATSLVRYAPESWFPEHKHPGGEEIFVLSGVFSEGDQHYPAGWYLRNPPGSAHQPSSREGAEMFVKLWQMPASARDSVRVNTGDPHSWRRCDQYDECELFVSQSERVSLVRLPADAPVPSSAGGIEILILAGELGAGTDVIRKGGWLRLPPGDHLPLAAGRLGATIYAKVGHLAAGNA